MSAFITEEQFKDLYDYATDESYNALIIDATKGRPIFKKIFEIMIGCTILRAVSGILRTHRGRRGSGLG